jgi:hypothetical protein
MKGPTVTSPLLILSLASIPLYAATQVDSVPVEVVQQLTGSGRQYSDMHENFPPFAVPAGLTVVYSLDQGYGQRVLLKTSLTAEEASAAASAAFIAEGWTPVQQGRPGAQVGFVSAVQPALPRTLCHDAYGVMNIGVAEGLASGAGARFVNLTRSGVDAGGRITTACSQMNDQAARFPRGGSMLDQYAPRLVMPASNVTGRATDFVGGGSRSSGNNDWSTSSSLISDWSIDEVFAHFGMQIEQQGWAKDAEVTGSQMAMGSWTKTVDGGLELIGNLNVIMTADDTYELGLRLVGKSRP